MDTLLVNYKPYKYLSITDVLFMTSIKKGVVIKNNVGHETCCQTDVLFKTLIAILSV